MAGRNTKTNFDFFRVYTGFFSNKKIKALRRKYGSVGILTWLYILDYTYGNDGYFIRIDNLEDFSYDVAESIADSNLRQVASVATDCINYLASRGEINKHLLDKGVISGESIQRQYIELCKSTKRKVEIKEEYRLVDTLEYPIEENPISSEEIAISSEEIAINSEEMQQSKVNKNKYIPPNACACANEEFTRRLQAFCKTWDIAIDTNSSLIVDLDFDKLNKAYSESKTLLQNKDKAPCAHTLSWVVKNATSIYAGKYKDRAGSNKNNASATTDILQRLFDAERLAEEGNDGTN